jgi:REP element-mobilizing transposase RayT
MPRSLRIVDLDSWHHVTLRGADRQDVFTDDCDRLHAEHLLGEIADRFGVETHAYCFMSNHLHLLEHCTDGRLSEALQYASSVYASRYNWRHGRTGPLFGGRFHSTTIESTEQLLQTSRYIHRNPLAFLGESMLAAYRAYVMDRQPTDPTPSGQLLRPTRSEVEHAVCSAAGTDPRALHRTVRGERNDARLLTILLLTELRVATTEHIVECYGFTNPSSVRNAARRARVLEADDPSFARLRRRVEELLLRRVTSMRRGV